MAWSSPFTAVTGATILASQANTGYRDNLNAIWVYTTQGDIVYATTASTLARLGLTAGGLLYGGASAPAWLPLVVGGVLYGGASAPAWASPPGVPALLMSVGASAPFWMAPNTVTGALHAKATADRTGNVGIAGDSVYHNITGATVNITTSVTCTFIVRGTIGIAVSTPGNTLIVRASIGATNDSGALPETSNGNFTPSPYEWYLPGVGAGTYTVKFMAWANGAGGTIDNARIAVYAIAE